MTTIPYSLPQRQHVVLSVVDLLGQTVRTLVHTPQRAGRHEVIFVAEDLPSGMYLYHLRAPIVTKTRAMMLIK